MILRLAFIATVFIILLSLAPEAKSKEDDLLEIARARNLAAIHSITSMQCRYERVLCGSTTIAQAQAPCFFMPAAPGRFWRSGETFRLIEPIRDGTTREYMARGGQLLVWRGGGPLKDPTLTLYTASPVDGVGGEMWQYLLFTQWGGGAPPGKGSYYYSDVADNPSRIVHLAERTPPPANEIHIDMSHTGSRCECWFNPRVNYLIRKFISFPPGEYSQSIHFEHEVIEFAEPAPAVYVPVIVEHRCYKNKALRATIRTILSDLKVNHNLAESDLYIPKIAGMKCIGMDREIQFTVDAAGNRVGPETPIKLAKVVPTPYEGEREFNYTPYEVSRPSTRWWIWILIASVCLLLLGVAVAVRRRVKAARDQEGVIR